MAKSESLKKSGFGQTSRKDSWWVVPLVTFIVLTGFIVYATWAAFQNANYSYGNYLSPFYSPEVWGSSPHAIFGPKPGWWPTFLPFSPALLILPFPALFRFTCYYYRGAYYKAFWADPPACAVGEPRKGYTGENGLPLIMQNVHRYFMYAALIFLLFLAHDAWKSFWFWDETALGYDPRGLGPFPNVPTHFGIGLGSLILTLNFVLLSFYTLSCHSLRHLIGGRRDCLTSKPVSLACYSCVSGLNKNHMLFAWMSLFGVMLADFYVRMCASGVISDFRIL